MYEGSGAEPLGAPCERVFVSTLALARDMMSTVPRIAKNDGDPGGPTSLEHSLCELDRDAAPRPLCNLCASFL